MLQCHVAQHKQEAAEVRHVVHAARLLGSGRLVRGRWLRLAASLRLRALLSLLPVARLLRCKPLRVHSIRGRRAAAGLALLTRLAVGAGKGLAGQVLQDGARHVLRGGVQGVDGGEGALGGRVPGGLWQRGGHHHAGQGGKDLRHDAVVGAAGSGWGGWGNHSTCSPGRHRMPLAGGEVCGRPSTAGAPTPPACLRLPAIRASCTAPLTPPCSWRPGAAA